MVPGTTESRVSTCSRCGARNGIHKGTSSDKEKLNDFLGIAYFTTLCQNCSEEIISLREEASKIPIDQPGTKLIEGVHFYMEKDLMVFTELYHMAKGYCCKSGCRHCAYGYKTEI